MSFMQMADLNSYGIKHFNLAQDDIDRHIEAIRLVGYTVVTSTCTEPKLTELSSRLDALYEKQAAAIGGHDVLKSIGDTDTVRLPLAEDEIFLKVATNPVILELIQRMLDGYIVLNQQNGLLNQPKRIHTQTSFHRDLPYQHFTTSAPIAMNALLCLNPFTADNGATWVVPASQHWDVCPSMESIKHLAVQIIAPAGSYIVMDSMVFHAAGNNYTNAPRRGINNSYMRGFMRQQIDIPAALQGRYSDDPKLSQLLGYKDKPPANTTAWRQIYIDRLKNGKG